MKKSDQLTEFKLPSKVGLSTTFTKTLEFAPTSEKKLHSSTKGKVQNEKLAALMAYRKAKGLCYKCGSKWGPQHTCLDSVSLNIIEEVWQMISDETMPSATTQEDSDSGEDLMAISTHAVQGTTSSKTIRLDCHILKNKAVVLVDSGSTHNFIREQLAALKPNWKLLEKPLQVRVANGSILTCTHEVTDCPWLIQGHQFHTTFRILPLQCYDAILGMDWLEQFSPMEIQWAQKWLTFHYQGEKVKLQGLTNSISSLLPVSGDQLLAMLKQDDIWCAVQVYALDSSTSQADTSIPPTMQQLLDKFSVIFAEPSGTPPVRCINHSIPLLPGTQPFRIRPYRYTPAQKDEIEKQVAHLLKHHMIQRSNSPYASPVLLVKKKTGEWRLCVDYRRLNAFTIKNKFPLPIIEELFEELFGAKWFTTLDLRSGFHQILVDLQDQYKTAFQTHSGHYEYKVMPYGLTGVPATL